MYSQKNDLNTTTVIFYDVIGCSIWVYNFILLKILLKHIFQLSPITENYLRQE